MDNDSFAQFFKSLHQEDSLDTLELKGDWSTERPYGYDKVSTKMMQNPKHLDRVKKKWDKLPYPVHAYLLKGPKVHTYTELGRVPWEFVRDTLKLDITFDDDAITIIYTNNKGDEKIPLTPWIMAHRLGHAMARDTTRNERPYMYTAINRTVDKLLKRVAEFYGKSSVNRSSSMPDEKLLNAVAQAVGTFKSARDKKLRASFELTNELIAQYIITGKITLNTNLPKMLPMSYAWGNPRGPWLRFTDERTQEDLVDDIEQYENDIMNDIDSLFGSSIGNIYVM